MLEDIGDFLIALVKVLIGSLIIVLLFGAIGATIGEPTKFHYEYTDLDNNEGIAVSCSYEFKEYKRGGQGSPVCELEDGTVIMVKKYKYVEERSEKK